MPFLAPIGAAIGGALTSFGTFLTGFAGSVFGKAVLGIGLNLAAQFLRRALTPKPAAAPSGTELETQFGGDRPRIVRCGRFGVAGHYTYANTGGPANRDLQQVYVISDFWTTALDRVWIDGLEVALGAEDPVKGRVVASGDYANLIWAKFHDGRQVAADAGLVASANPAARWTANHTLTGMSYVVVTLEYDQERLGSTVQMFFEGRGAPLYDWRRDTTVGGSGAHRWDDPATWEFSENPVLMDYAYRRGFAINGEIFCGMAMAEGDLPVSRWSVAANICDELFNGETRYRCAIGFDCSADHGDNVEAVMKACGGIVVHGVDGAWPLIGTDQVAVATLTDDDLIVGRPVRFQARRPANELVNSVAGTFPDPGNQWSPTGYERATDAATVAIDRRSKDVAIDFETVPYPRQAAQLAAIYFSENRFEASAAITVRPRWQVLEPGDWIVWQSERYGTRTYMVTDMALASLQGDGPRNVALSLQERGGAIYDSVGVVTLPLVPPPNAEPVRQQEMFDFTVVPSQMVGDRGQVAAAIRASWSAPIDPDITGTVIEYRVKAGPADIFEVGVPRSRTVALLTTGVVSNTVYEVRHRLVTDPPRPITPSSWVDVTTLDTPASDVTVRLGNLEPDVRDWMRHTQAQLDQAAQWIALEAGQASIDVAENFVERTGIRRTANDAVARITTEEQVRASEGAALAQRITVAETSIGDVSTQVSSVDQARIDGDAALARQISQVAAGIGDSLAGGLISIRASASPTGGAQAQIDFVVRATAGGTDTQTALSLRAYSDGTSDILMQAGRVIMTDGAAETLPFLFQSGELVLQLANIGTITTGLIQSANGKHTYNVATGEMAWFN